MGKRVLLAALLCGILSGCSLFSTEESVEVVQGAPPKPVLKKVVREPGSLWSEDSRWNDLYTVAPSRVLGDMLKIKIQDGLKQRFEKMVAAQKAVIDNPPVAKIAAVAEGKAPEADPKVAAKPEQEFLDAVITDVLPRGVFAIAARQIVKAGPVEMRMDLVGNVREKDIGTDDVVPSDAIINLNVIYQAGGAGQTVAVEGGRQ